MIKKCLTCNKEFVTYPYQIKIGKGKFCSHKCMSISFITSVSIMCKNCGKTFKVKKSRKNKAKFCSYECYWKSTIGKAPVCAFNKGYIPWNKDMKFPERSGSNSPFWKGGRMLSNGYVLIHSPNHPNCDSHNYVSEHRLITEKCLGRYLTRKEVIHHINKNKLDNHPENLYLFSSNSTHTSYEGLKNKPVLKSNLI